MHYTENIYATRVKVAAYSVQLVVFSLIGSAYMSTPANAWHENMGISDQRATELYIINPQNQDIENWKAGLLELIAFFVRDCVDNPGSIEIDSCNIKSNTIYYNCLHHPAIKSNQNSQMNMRINKYIEEHPIVVDVNGKMTVLPIQPKQLSTIEDYNEFYGSIFALGIYGLVNLASPC